MFVTRANPNGGRPLSSYPLDEDKRSGNLGYKIGYCAGCGEPVLIRTIDVAEIVDRFGLSDQFYRKKFLSKGFFGWFRKSKE
jgi:hypothetical protein